VLDLLKNGIFTGIGVAIVTREKVEEKLRRLVREGKITSEEASRLADELVDSGRSHWEDMRERLLESVRGGIEPLGLASREYVETLERRVTDLEDSRKAMEIRLSVLEEKIEGQQEDEQEEAGEEPAE
jgi:polyhydroxyalkanoate synthesis regulator phasin